MTMNMERTNLPNKIKPAHQAPIQFGSSGLIEKDNLLVKSAGYCNRVAPSANPTTGPIAEAAY